MIQVFEYDENAANKKSRCVQRRLACSEGFNPSEAIARSPVAVNGGQEESRMT